jgi:hypothetical protein
MINTITATATVVLWLKKLSATRPIRIKRVVSNMESVSFLANEK